MFTVQCFVQCQCYNHGDATDTDSGPAFPSNSRGDSRDSKKDSRHTRCLWRRRGDGVRVSVNPSSVKSQYKRYTHHLYQRWMIGPTLMVPCAIACVLKLNDVWMNVFQYEGNILYWYDCINAVLATDNKCPFNLSTLKNTHFWSDAVTNLCVRKSYI